MGKKVRLFFSAGIQAACPGGEIVYSTCTLSHNQNQGVVEQAMHMAREQHDIHLQVSELTIVTRDKVFHERLHWCEHRSWSISGSIRTSLS